MGYLCQNECNNFMNLLQKWECLYYIIKSLNMLFGAPGKTNNFEYSNSAYFPPAKQINQKSTCTFNNSFTIGQKCSSHQKLSRNGDQRFFNFQNPSFITKTEPPLPYEDERFKQTVVFKPSTHIQFSKINFNPSNMPLQQQCLILRKQKSQLSQKMKKAQQQLQSKQNMIKGKQKEIEQLKLIHSQSCSTKSQSQVLSDLRSEKQKLYFQVIQLQTEIHKMQEKYEKIQREHYGLSQKYDQMANKSTLQLSRKISKQELLQSELSLSEKRNQRIKIEYQKQIATLKQKIRDQSLQNSSAKYPNKSTVLSYNQSSFSDTYTPLKSQPDLQNSNIHKADIQKLQTQIKQKNQMIRYLQMQCLKDKRRQTQNQAMKSNNVHEECKKQLGRVMKDGENMRKEIVGLQGKCASSDRMREELMRQVKDLEYLLKEVRDKLCKTMEQNRGINKRERQNNEKLNEKIHQLQGQLSKCSAKFRQQLQQNKKAYEKAMLQCKQKNTNELILKQQQVKQYSIQKQQLLSKVYEYQKLVKQQYQNTSQFQQLRLKMKQSEQQRTKLQLKVANEFQLTIQNLQKQLSTKTQQLHTTLTTLHKQLSAKKILQYKVRQLEQLACRLEEEKKKMGDDRKIMEEEVGRLVKERDMLRKEEGELERKGMDRDRHYEIEIRGLEVRMGKEVEKYENLVGYLREEERKLRNMIADRQRDNLNLTISYQNQKQKYSDASQKLKSTKQQKKQLKKQLQLTKQKHTQLQNTLTTLQQQHTQLTHLHQTSTTTQTQLLHKIQTLQQQKTANQHKIEQMRNKIEQMHNNIVQYEQDIRLYQLQLISINEMKAGLSRKDVELMSLRQLNEGIGSMMKIQVGKIDGLLVEREKELQGKCEEIGKLKEEIGKLKEEIGKLKQQIVVVNSNMAQQTNRHKSQLQQLHTKHNQQTTKLTQQLQQLYTNISQQQHKLTQQAQLTIHTKQQQITKLKQQILTIKQQTQQQITGLQKQITGLQKQITGLQKQITGLQKQITDMSEVVTDMNVVIANLNKQRDNVDGRLLQVERVRQGLEGKVFQLQVELAQCYNKLEATNKQCSELTISCQQISKDKIIKQALISQLQQKLKKILQWAQQKTQSSAEQSQTLTQLTNPLTQTQTKLNQQTQSHTQTKTLLSQTQSQLNQLQQSHSQLQSQLQNTKQQTQFLHITLKQKQQQLDQTLKHYCTQLQTCKNQLLDNQCTIQQLKLKLQMYEQVDEQNRKSLDQKDRYNREIEIEIEELTRELQEIKGKFMEAECKWKESVVTAELQSMEKPREEEQARSLKISKMSGLSSQSFIGDFIQIDKNALLHICDLLGLQAVDGCLLSSIIQFIQNSNYLTINEYYRQILQLFGVDADETQKMQQKLIAQIKSFRETLINLVEKVSMLQGRVEGLSKENHRLVKQINKLQFKQMRLYNIEIILEGLNEDSMKCKLHKLNKKYEEQVVDDSQQIS